MYALLENTIFAGRYRIVRSIAAGGMGAVYEATHIETERRRALKVMHPHFVQDEDMRERFRREARVGARVQSEHIVEIFDAGVDETTGMPFLVMELLEGEDLGHRLRRLGRLSPGNTVLYLRQAARALDKAHTAAVIHRDLKPDNLFLANRDDGQPLIKILDFGIAKFLSEVGAHGGPTRSLGTPLYMPPEQLRTAQGLSPQTDLYALAMVTYTLLVGQSYWYEEAAVHTEPLAFALVTLNGLSELASIRAARRGVTLPPMFDAWFQKATALNPAERFATASAMVRALEEALGCPAPGNEASPVAPIIPGFTSGHGTPRTGPGGGAFELPPGSLSGSQSGAVSISGLQLTTKRSLSKGMLLALSSLVLTLVLIGGGLSFYLSHGNDPPQLGSTQPSLLPLEPQTGLPEPSPPPTTSGMNQSSTTSELQAGTPPIVVVPSASAVPSAAKPAVAPGPPRATAPVVPQPTAKAAPVSTVKPAPNIHSRD